MLTGWLRLCRTEILFLYRVSACFHHVLRLTRRCKNPAVEFRLCHREQRVVRLPKAMQISWCWWFRWRRVADVVNLEVP